jgi:hypothetical protein
MGRALSVKLTRRGAALGFALRLRGNDTKHVNEALTQVAILYALFLSFAPTSP